MSNDVDSSSISEKEKIGYHQHLANEVKAETQKEAIKWLVKIGLMALFAIISLLGTALWFAYESYLEPRIARRIAEMITKDTNFDGAKNPLIRYMAQGIVREIGTKGGMHADSVQAGDLKVKFRGDQITQDSVSRRDFVGLIHRGQRVKILLLNSRVSILNESGKERKSSYSAGDGINLVFQCDCFKTEDRQVRIHDLKEDDDLESIDLTDKIRWGDEKSYKLIRLSTTVEPKSFSLKYLFNSTVVVLIYNSLEGSAHTVQAASPERPVQ